MRTTTFLAIGLCGLGLALSGCRGMKSEKPPIHPNLNMDFNERFEEQEANPFFADNAAMRQPVAGTVARGQLRTTENAPFYYGRSADGNYVQTIPVALTDDFLGRGETIYNVYCTPCHGIAGDGQGIIMTGKGGNGYGYTQAPSYHTDRLRDASDGYIYDVIANGVRNMAGYAHQIEPQDRWAVVSYVRALQLSQAAAETDVPSAELERLRSANPNVNLAP
jgi:mono/diheme cytochrome c family protein